MTINELARVHAANLRAVNTVRAKYEAAVYLKPRRAWAYYYRLALRNSRESARDLYCAIRADRPDMPEAAEFTFLKAA